MKKNPIIITLIFLFFLPFGEGRRSYAQDFNLFNPSNEMYLFSAYDEGANAFRYNPAVLGIKHRFNFSMGIFLENYRNKTSFNEFDVSVNTGILGLAFRNNTVFIDNGFLRPSYNRSDNNFSLGLGFGNKTLTSGILIEYLTSSNLSKPDFYDYDKSRFRAGLGFLYRPADFLSTSLVFRSHKSLSKESYLGIQVTMGCGIRPLGNSILTLLFDFNFIPYDNYGFFEINSYKAGINLDLIKGVSLYANYLRINDVFREQFINIGMSFDFPHSSIRYNNTLTKFSERDNSPSTYKTQGHNISLSYFSELRESIIPEKNKILEITLSGNLQDYNTEDVFFGILGEGKRSVHQVIADIDYAAKDESVKGILLKIYPLSEGRFDINAAAEELTNAMMRFRASGKRITAYFPQNAGPGEYYIATFADEIVIPEEGILFYGLSIEVFNYKQFLEKYGIELQTLYAGKYKLTFQGLLDSTTEEGKEVINRILDIVYDKMLKRITEGKKLQLDDYLRKKLSQPLIGREAKKLGLVNANGWYEDAKEMIVRSAGVETIHELSLRKKWDYGWSEPEEIAIVGVYGSIASGESEPPSIIRLPIPFIGGGRSTGSETVIRQLEDAFSNPKVKAVILRVDSGGGSGLASAEINNAIIRLKKKYKKLFIVSMGGAAASGGYEVSVNADKIFADDLTVTGSIGVWFAKPNIDSLLKGQRIKVETFKRGENSDIVSLYKHLDEEEIKIIQSLIDYYYDSFIETVAKGRKMTKEEADQVAQGRVWLGTDAFNKKLVDEIGGLYEAINYAKEKSNIDKRFKLVYYAVPGGETISEIVTTTLVKYFEKNLGKWFGFGDEDGIEIKK